MCYVPSAALGMGFSDCISVQLFVTETCEIPSDCNTFTTPHAQERVPFQYLTHGSHWSRYILSVGTGVLIPRPETEAFFPDFVKKAVTSNPALALSPWLDLGTGSGAIAIACADALRAVNKV